MKTKRGEWLDRLPTEIGGCVLAVHPMGARQMELFERKPLTVSQALERLLTGKSTPDAAADTSHIVDITEQSNGTVTIITGAKKPSEE